MALPPPDSIAEPLITARGAGLTFPGGTRALAGLDLSIIPGEFVSILGPSGCGKSTFLRAAAGLIPATEGELVVEGMTPAEARRRRSDMAFVFQQAALLPWRTVDENVLLPLELAGRKDGARAAELLELVGLSDFRTAMPHELSGGMQMRVSLARALVTRPSILLLDEPFGALDEITRQRLNEELLALWQRDRFTALFVTHNVYESVFLSERVLVMSARPGRIVHEEAVPFDYPRAPGLRGTAEFAAVSESLAARLREAAA